MCGLTGFLAPEQSDDLAGLVRGMAAPLTPRGPDDFGVWTDGAAGVALGHCRLAILDLSAEGHQPMHSACGRYVLVVNGEIYNFKALREELKALGHAFRGRSDTEVMLGAIGQWGVESAVGRFNGMFAFALWDRHAQKLYLARDRVGIKPLYYGWIGRVFVFGSELKAIRAHPEFQREIDRNAAVLLMRYAYIPAPCSVYRGIYKLLPGTILTVTGDRVARRDAFSPHASRGASAWGPVPYWSARDGVEQGAAHPFRGSDEKAVEQLDRLLRDAVGLRMVADVPLGAFLSGGIDSSTVVALMQAQSDRPVRTFSIGFAEPGYNEAVYAKAVAGHLGTDHTELYVTSKEMLGVLSRLPTLYDEPFADSSQIPTFLVSQLTRQHVKVSLSGDGGDELFCGYDRYGASRMLWQGTRWLPGPIRCAVSRGLSALPTSAWDRAFRWTAPLFNRQGHAGRVSDKLYKLAGVLAEETPEALYRGLVSHWEDAPDLVRGAVEPKTVFTDAEGWADLPDFMQWMMYLDLVSYLPCDILTKVDRASMGTGLEARVPLLDHRVVAFAWRVPMSMKVRAGQGKWLLRQVLYRYVPRELFARPKMGFGVPVGTWLRGPLRDWAEGLLDERRLRNEGIFDPNPLRERWDEHLCGKRNWQHALWNVLMFQAWLEDQAGAS